MLIKTHLSITLFFVLFLLSSVEHKLVFVLVALIATFIPDIDSRFSIFGQKKILRILQFFTKHRGIIHSFTFLLIVTLIFVLFYPIVALGFFLGYGLHLLADSFNIRGIKPFYPYKKISKGKIKTGGRSEIIVFVLFIIGDLVLILGKIFSVF